MKKQLLTFLCGISIYSLQAQLSGTALALYNECYNKDVTRGNYATSNGVQTLATADGNSFMLKWFPASTTPSTTPLVVTIHGTGGNAFDEFYLWHARAQAKGCGIIAVQYYRGAAAVSPNDYFDDPTIYSYMKTALTGINYPPNKALLHGFSRGSARSYAVAFNDLTSQGGNNYFCTVFSNAGKPDSAYPLYTQINSGMYGHSLYNGKKWGMFCGGMDSNPAQSGCPAMANAKNWVQANGGTVGLYISDASLPHGGFQLTPAYLDQCLDYYLTCYGPTKINELNQSQDHFSVFPNPARDYFIIKNIGINTVETSINIQDALGRKVYETMFVNEVNVDSKNWSKGIYFYQIKSSENILESGKLLIQ